MASVPLNYYDLIDAMQQRDGCPVCQLLLRDTEQLLDSLLYEYSNSYLIHQKIRASRGLCNLHTWQLVEFKGNVLNIAVLQEAALDEILRILDQAGSRLNIRLSRWRSSDASSLADQLEARERCFVCESLDKAEQHYLTTFASHLPDSRFQEAYQQSSGLCLAHFRQALRLAQPKAARLLTEAQTAIWKTLQAELESLINQYDVNKTGGQILHDADSLQRVLEALVSAPGIRGSGRTTR